ncbi:MAG: FAD binding domain-containing protein [Burkholderiaceae bacterium]
MTPLHAARFEQPVTVAEALRSMALGRHRPLAGGTDLYPACVGRSVDAPLLDLSRIPALRGIRRDAQGWWFGATTTWTDVQRAELPPLFDALKQAAREIGGEQIQNTATLGGNLCNASPAADGTPVWLALDASAVLESADGERRVPVAEFVFGNRRTVLAPNELLTGLWVPRRSASARSRFIKLGSRRYLVISITMVALLIDVDASRRVVWAGVSVGSCAERAQRLHSLETRLIGLPRSGLANCSVSHADLAPLQPIDDVRASAAYRLDATATLLQRSLRELAA